MSLSIAYDRTQARRLAFGLVGIACAFALAFVVIHILYPERFRISVRRFVDLDDEVSLSTWFSTLQLFIVGALLLLVARNNHQPQHMSSRALIVAGLVFIGLSADEAAQIHENLTYLSRDLALSELGFIGPWGAWIYVYAVLGLVGVALGARHIRAVWRHFHEVAVIGLVGAATFVLGAVGFEIASFPFRRSEESLTLKLIAVTIEELLEMVGVTIMLYATLLLGLDLSRSRQSAPGFHRASPA